jgi:hypothetical protein
MEINNILETEDREVFMTLWLFWFMCGNEAYTDSFFGKIVVKVLLSQHFTIP